MARRCRGATLAGWSDGYLMFMNITYIYIYIYVYTYVCYLIFIDLLRLVSSSRKHVYVQFWNVRFPGGLGTHWAGYPVSWCRCNLTRTKCACFRGGARSCLARQTDASYTSMLHWSRIVRRPSVVHPLIEFPSCCTGPSTAKVTRRLQWAAISSRTWLEQMRGNPQPCK